MTAAADSLPAENAERWLRDHGDALWRFATSRVSPDVAEDLVQETLLAALQAAPTFDGRSSAETWLLGILSHKIADHYRRRARDRSGAAMPVPEDAAMSQFTDRGMWSPSPGRWDHTTDAELLAHLAECRDKLPPILRDAIELRDLRQLSSEVVCQVLGVSPTNLWTRLHRARMALRKCIDARVRSGSEGKGA